MDDENYSGVPRNMMYILMVFRNSIGGDQTPVYKHWQLLETYGDGPYGNGTVKGRYTWVTNLMIGYAWLLWLLNAFFTMIVMLNFLIAIVGQSYDNVMSTYQVSLYKSKCHFNLKGTLIMNSMDSFFNFSKRNVKMNIVSVTMDAFEGDNDQQAYLKNIKAAFSSEISKISVKIEEAL